VLVAVELNGVVDSDMDKVTNMSEKGGEFGKKPEHGDEVAA
jgi:hypothetical protein